MGPIQSIADFIDMLRRRAVLIVVVTFVGCVASLLYALSQQHLYQSWAVLQVAQPMIADDLAKSTVEGSSARRLQLIQQRLLARDTILQIADKYEIYADQPDMRPQSKVDALRAAVRIEGVAAAREGFTDDGTVSVLTITANMPTPEQAQQVAGEFAERTIALSRESRISQARETLEFFQVQEEALIEAVKKVEGELSEYRNTHQLILPGSIEFRREEIGVINEGLLEIARERITLERRAEQVAENERRATAQRKLADIEEEIATLDAQQRVLLDRKNELERMLESTPVIQQELAAIERRLSDYREELSEITDRRTEAEVGYRLEEGARSERLTVIEPATLPEFPITGSRKRIALLGGALSGMLALALAFWLELRNPVIRNAAQMERELGIQPVVSVPFLDTRPPRRPGLFRRLFGRGGGTPSADKA